MDVLTDISDVATFGLPGEGKVGERHVQHIAGRPVSHTGAEFTHIRFGSVRFGSVRFGSVWSSSKFSSA